MNILQKNTLKVIISIICFSTIFYTYLMQFEGPASGYWDTYIAAPALLMINRPVNFTSTEGVSFYQYTLPGKLPENLVRPLDNV